MTINLAVHSLPSSASASSKRSSWRSSAQPSRDVADGGGGRGQLKRMGSLQQAAGGASMGGGGQAKSNWKGGRMAAASAVIAQVPERPRQRVKGGSGAKATRGSRQREIQRPSCNG